MSGVYHGVRNAYAIAQQIADQEKTIKEWARSQIGVLDSKKFVMTVSIREAKDPSIFAFFRTGKMFTVDVVLSEVATGDMVAVKQWEWQDLSEELKSWLSQGRLRKLTF